MLCLCNFGWRCGEIRGQSRIFPVGRRPARRERATVSDSDKTRHLLLLPSDRVQKQLAKVTPLAELVTASHTVTVPHLHFQNTYPHVHTLQNQTVSSKNLLCDLCTHTNLKTDAWLLGFLFQLVSKVLHQPCPTWKCLSWNDVRSSGLSMEYAKKLVFLWSLKKPRILCPCCAVYLLHVLWKSSLNGLCARIQVLGSYTIALCGEQSNV